MPHQWLHGLAWVALVAGLLSALVIVADELRRPQHMWIMNVVWPDVGGNQGRHALAGGLATGHVRVDGDRVISDLRPLTGKDRPSLLVHDADPDAVRVRNQSPGQW